MKPETLSILCSPETKKPLKLEILPGPSGHMQEFLVSKESEKYSIQDGIPQLFDESKILNINARYRKVYDKVAWAYDAAIRMFAMLAAGGEEKFRREYLQEFALHDGDRLLEVSVGTGANLRYLPSNLELFGLDLSGGMLKKCQKNLKRWKLDAELIAGNAEWLPFQKNSFDAVLHVGGINAFDDRGKAIAEMIRVARPGAKIVIVDETAKLIHTLAWIPGVKKKLRQYSGRFLPPVEFVPKSMHDVQVKQIVKGDMYCLSFVK